MKKIKLHGKYGEGKFAIVDDDIYDKYKNKNMHCTESGYVIFGHNKSLHREIMNPPEGMVIDHKNHNPLDNRRDNLRICTQAENTRNRKSKGYSWDNFHGYWVVTMRKNGKIQTRVCHSEETAKKMVKEWRSGKEPENKRMKKKWGYPANIWRNRHSGFRVDFQHNGIRYLKYGFKTVSDAVEYRNKLFNEIGRAIND